jgi:hypothetical protein
MISKKAISLSFCTVIILASYSSQLFKITIYSEFLFTTTWLFVIIIQSLFIKKPVHHQTLLSKNQYLFCLNISKSFFSIMLTTDEEAFFEIEIIFFSRE